MDVRREQGAPTTVSPALPPQRVGAAAKLGLALCGLSALFYSVSSILMRHAAGLQIEPSIAVCIREAVTVAMVAPWLLYRLWRGRSVGLPARALAILIAISAAAQVVGNQSHQWALGVVGLSIVVPVSFAAVLITGPLLGRFFLREPVAARSWVAVATVISAIVVLSSGARSAEPSAVVASGGLSGIVIAAVLGSALAGMTYATLTVAIRRNVTHDAPIATVLLLVTGMGVITVGPISWANVGWEGWRSLPAEAWAWLLTAGLVNFAGFISLTVGLRMTPVVHANVLGAAQVAIAAMAGLLIFREPLTITLIVGVALTICGILLIGGNRNTPTETA